MNLRIAQLGQPVLRQVAVEVPPEEIATPEFQQFLKDMHDTLEEEQGAGLAAPQVFVSRRVFLAMIPSGPGAETVSAETFINPRFLEMSEEQAAAWEGCLSFPELLVKVPRSIRVVIEYWNAQGEKKVRELHRFAARVVQHELDHLDGTLTIDRTPSTRYIVKASEIEDVGE